MSFEPDPDLAAPSPERAALDAVEAALSETATAPFDPVAATLALRAALAEPSVLPRGARLRLWRELEGARLAREAGLNLALWGAVAAAAALDRFGSAPRRGVTATAEQALAAARNTGVVAVLALEGAWWGRLLAEPALRVFAALPEDRPSGPLALAVAQVATGPTGDDRTLFVTDAEGSAAGVEAALGALGLAADLWAQAGAMAGGLKLFALAGYVQPHDVRLAGAPGRLKGVIGAAPFGLRP